MKDPDILYLFSPLQFRAFGLCFASGAGSGGLGHDVC